MDNFSSKRERRQERLQKQKGRSTLLWSLVGLGALALVGFLIWSGSRIGSVNADPAKASGEQFPIQGSNHIPDGTDPGEYNSNPPTSGPHYEVPLPAGFYEEADLQAWEPFSVAHAVHNLEHGYIVFWYNCNLLDESACTELKTQIRDFIAGFPIRKLVAFPWPTGESPIALSSWGYRLVMQEFNADQATSFINANRMLAPEANAP